MTLVLLLFLLVSCGGGLGSAAMVASDSDEKVRTDKMLTDKIERLEAQNREQGAIIQNLTNLMNEFCQTFQLLHRDGAAVNNTGPTVQHGELILCCILAF